jgi:hypothetical protein
MIQTIRLDRVLREAVRTPYADLVTRSTGAAVRVRIRQALDDPECRAACLDFSAVGLVDFSCADEVVAKLLLDLPPDHAPFLLLAGISESHREAIDHVLEWHSLAVAALPAAGGPPAVLGRLDPDARTAFGRIAETGPGTAERVAALLGWTMERAAVALQTLALLRLVQAAGGTYSPLPIPA